MPANILRKAQIKMAESVGVLFIFFILLGFGMIFYSNFQKSGMAETQLEFSEMTAVELSQKISFLPEIACTKNGVVDQDCFDIIKLDNLTKRIKDRHDDTFMDYYSQVFGNANITVTQVYPLVDPDEDPYNPSTHRSWYLYNRTPPGQYSTFFTQVPVVLFNATTGDPDERYFGVLEVEVYVPVVTG